MYIPESEEEKQYLEKYDSNKYPKPSVTVDFIVHIDGEGILFVKRKNYPYKGYWALPGGFLDVGKENTLQAAIRELKEETSLEIDNNNIKLVGVYSDPLRDPRDHVVSVVYAVKLTNQYINMVKANDDAADAKFIQINTNGSIISELSTIKLAFDHEQIICDYVNSLRS